MPHHLRATHTPVVAPAQVARMAQRLARGEGVQVGRVAAGYVGGVQVALVVACTMV